MSTPFDAESADKLLREKLRAVEQVLTLTRKQLAVIDTGDWTGLLALLQTKRSMIDHMERIDAVLNPWWELDPALRVFPSPSARKACQDLIDRCRAMMLETLDLEQTCDARVKLQHQQTAELLQATDAVNSAGHAYAERGFDSSDVPAGQLDLSSEQ